MNTAYLSIGSNVGERERNLDMVAELLEKNGVKVTGVSELYETEPYGYREQEWFYNRVLEIETDLSPRELLQLCQRLEVEIGREKSFKWGPRVIDIDIVTFGDEVVDEEDLKIPHPHYLMRRFVLEPMCDVNFSAKELLNECSDTSIVRRLT